MRKMQLAIRVFIAAITAATFSLPLVSIAQAQQSAAYRAGVVSHAPLGRQHLFYR